MVSEGDGVAVSVGVLLEVIVLEGECEGVPVPVGVEDEVPVAEAVTALVIDCDLLDAEVSVNEALIVPVTDDSPVEVCDGISAREGDLVDEDLGVGEVLPVTDGVPVDE